MVAKLEHEIREIFNIPRRHKNTRNDTAAFNQACSALDAIGDTELALQEYVVWDATFGIGINYILAYGVLQAIFLQQDAIKHLALSLGLPFKLPKKLREIRELRNDAAGHPTHRDVNKKKGIKSFHHISRVTLSKKGFQLLSTYSNRDSFDFRNIDLYELIKIQSKFAEELLTEILGALRKNENAHREKYMREKLAEIFHPSISYLFEKTSEGIRNNERRQFGLANFESINEMISSFEKKLEERGEEESIEYLKQELAYPTEKLRNYLNGDNTVDQRAAEIFLHYIKNKIEELKQIAQEIDEEYKKRV